MKHPAWTIACSSILLASLLALPVRAQPFPDKPIRILVGVPAGAGQDVEARQFGKELSVELGQPVIVENKPGFSQLLAIDALAKAPADGYTLVMSTVVFASHPRLFDRPLFNVDKDFAPISLLGEHPWVLYVNSNLPVKNLAEFVALAKSKPGKLTYASTGVGSFQHLTGEWLQKITGTSLTHVPYGAQGWQADLLGGSVDATLFPLISMVEHVKSGKLRALAISSGQRSPQLPDVPTFAEASYPEFTARAWYGLVAPAGLPAPVMARLNAASVKAVQSPTYREFLATIGVTPIGGAPADFENFLKSERARWRNVITDANIRLD